MKLTENAPMTPRRAQGIAFLCGVGSMAIEMSASRLLAPYFGTTFAVWTNIIGVMMLAMSLGYYLGGILADRYPNPAGLRLVVLGSGILAGIVPLLARLVLSSIVDQWNLAEFPGSFVGTLLLFSPSAFMLGMVNPYAVRLVAPDVESAGSLSGRIYALSTGGSLLGTILPVLLTIPLIGTEKTIYAFAVLLLLTGVIAGMPSARRTA